MNDCLTSRKNDCKNCYRCIRHCPTKSISFINNQASIIHDECVLCGQCFLQCPQETKVIRNDVQKVKQLIQNNQKVIVSLAPSFIANYKGTSIKTMKEALIKLGFYDVEETAIGATIVKKAYDNMLKENRDIIISSCCHSVNLLIQKHHPKVLPFLADVYSPMLAHAKDIKRRYKDAKVVFIGPCIAKKDEADKNAQLVDAVLTYIELSSWLKEEEIEIQKEENRVIIENSKARLFPTSGGILKTMAKSEETFTYLVIDGMDNCLKAIEDIETGKVHKCFIEMSACAGSCINGPAMENENRSIIQDYLAIQKSAGKKDFLVDELTYNDIKRTFYKIHVTKATPNESDIQRVLDETGKNSREKELNCGSCGYSSCRQKAIAILEGKAIKEMCLPYLMEKAQSFSNNIVNNSPNGLMVLDENLKIQLINHSMCNIVAISNPEVVINQNVDVILNAESYAKALGNETIRNKKIFLAEYNKYVEETIVYDTKFHIIISIMRDITQKELDAQKKDELVKKSIEITNKVIDKNMRSVQEIASLLGETAAETKVALSSLKNSLKDEDE